jgi:hypothetical protein
MKNINEPLNTLLKLAKQEKTPQVDVHCKVMKTLAESQNETPREFAFTEVAAIAAIVMGSLLFLSTWQEIFTPWNLFFLN